MPVLAFPDFSTDFNLEMDASEVGLGAVLTQVQKDGQTRPMVFAFAVWAVKH